MQQKGKSRRWFMVNDRRRPAISLSGASNPAGKPYRKEASYLKAAFDTPHSTPLRRRDADGQQARRQAPNPVLEKSLSFHTVSVPGATGLACTLAASLESGG
jgi:hypothetical protein